MKVKANMIDVKNERIVINSLIIDFTEITIIEGFYFRLECGETGEERFNADISFVATRKDENIPLKIKFHDVIDLKIDPDSIYTTGFGIFDTKQRGWSGDCRYHFHFQDYDDGEMDFYCSEIELME